MADTIVVVDTNIIWPSNLLASQAWSDLLTNAEKWGVRIAIPWVVLQEAVNRASREWEEHRSKLTALKLDGLRLRTEKRQSVDQIDAAIKRYEEDLRNRLAEISADIVPIPARVDLEDLVMRAIRRRAPYLRKDTDCFRDTLIWLTVCNIAAVNPDSTVWFVSENHNDFGDINEPDKKKCPYPLHRDLVHELEEQQLVNRVRHAASLDRLVQHFSSSHDGVPDTKKDALTGTLDRADFDEHLNSAVSGKVLDPVSVGLPDETTHSVLMDSFTKDPNDLEFFDLAISDSAEGRWTAQFSTPILATVSLREFVADSVLKRTIRGQHLLVIGRVMVERDGSVFYMHVETPEALPTNPVRRVSNGQNEEKPHGGTTA